MKTCNLMTSSPNVVKLAIACYSGILFHVTDRFFVIIFFCDVFYLVLREVTNTIYN